MSVNHQRSQADLVIFSGIEVNWLRYAQFLFNNENQDLYDHTTNETGTRYFLGNKLGEYSWCSVIPIDDLREFSANDKVRFVRFELGKLDPEYLNVYPQIFIIKKKD